MAEEAQYALKRKYEEQPTATDLDFEAAKQRAQEVAARLLGASGGSPLPVDLKRAKPDNGVPTSGFDSFDLKPQYSAPYGSSKKIDIPNGRVGVLIGKGGETIKYLQLQSGAKIQITRDMDADPNSPTRMVELMGTPDAIASAEKLINEVLAEAEAGGSGSVSRRMPGHGGADEFSMKIPNNKVGLIIGKGGETIKTMQASTGARIQVIPLHLPPGDTSTERTLKIDGTPEQIESAKQLVNQIVTGEGYSVYWTVGDTNMNPFVGVPSACPGKGCASAGVIRFHQEPVQYNRLRNPANSGGYPQQGYQSRPPSSWAPPAAPVQQPGYGYVQPGSYSGPSPQYSQSPYAGYPPQQPGGYSANWDQSTAPSHQQQSTQASGYDYYSQQPQQQQNPGAPAPAVDGSTYNYSQPPSSGYSQPGQGYGQDSYSGYNAPPQPGYGQPPTYDQQGYGSAPSYGSGSNPAQEGHTSNYGSQGDSTQAPQPPSTNAQQGYATTQQPGSNTANYPPQGTTQPSYGVPPTSQAAYGSQPQSGYGSGYAQPPPSGYAQPESGSQRTPPSGYGGAVQAGYGTQSYGAPQGGQPGYGQAPPSYGNSSYGAGYTQAPAYASDGGAGGNNGAPAQAAQPGGVAKASPQS